jgi:ribosomal protein S12 methylthiotransferase
MKRGGNAESLKKLLERVRRQVPGVTLRTSLIVGYPGETEEEFGQLCEFVEEIQFDRLGTFTYSDEENTASFHLPDKVEDSIIRRREKKVMQLQAKISRRINRELKGKRVRVLVEGPAEQTDLLWQGRMESQAPRIDGLVLINDVEGPIPQSGEFRTVEITRALDYDLVGKIVE